MSNELPETLFGLPIYWTELGKESKPISLIVLGTLDEYVLRRPITIEELRRLLVGKAVLIEDIEEETLRGLDECLAPLTPEQWDFLLERAKAKEEEDERS